MIYILSGTCDQAKNYAEKKQLRYQDWLPLTGVHQLKGTRNKKVHAVGSWYRRPDIAEISQEIICREAEVEYPHY